MLFDTHPKAAFYPDTAYHLLSPRLFFRWLELPDEGLVSCFRGSKFWEKYLIKYWIGGKDKKKERNVLSLNAVLYRQWTDGFKVFALFCARDRMGNGGRVLEERQVALLDQTAPGELWGVDTPHLPTQCSSGSSDLPCLMLLRWPSKQRWREGAGGGGEYRERCWQKHLWLWTSRGLLLWKQTATSSAGKVCCQRPPLPRSRST